MTEHTDPREALAMLLDMEVAADIGRLRDSVDHDDLHQKTVLDLGLPYGDGADGLDNIHNRLIYSVSWAYCLVRLTYDRR